MPLPVFRYCTDGDHFDIPFPDWSFWGWPELNIHPWEEQFREIKWGSQSSIFGLKKKKVGFSGKKLEKEGAFCILERKPRC
ncbi:hypothetical protein ACFX12_006096 [Malus domestica]